VKHTVFFPRLDGLGMALVRRSLERLEHACAEGHRCLHEAGGAHPAFRDVLEPMGEMHRTASLGLRRLMTEIGTPIVPVPPIDPLICFRCPDLLDAARQHDGAGLLAECELGERALSRVYHETLDAPIPPHLAAEIEAQLLMVDQALIQLRTLRELRETMPRSA